MASIEDDNPVVFIEHRWLYNIHGIVPEEAYTVPLGVPSVLREGTDVTIVALSYMTLEAMRAAELLEKEGIQAEVVDLRTLSPLNDEPILESVRKTGRLVACDHATMTAGFSAELVSRVAEKVFASLTDAPVRVTLPDCPTPTTRALANYYYPTPRHIVAAAKQTLRLPTEDPTLEIGPSDLLDVPDPSFTGPF
jgi:pyruvate dehydrogenase E1 component beta subunit